MRLTVVGSGTVVPDAERTGACFFIEADGVRMLLDCGPGATHHMARFGLPWARVTHVVLSHFHTDHVGGLPPLLFALRYAVRTPRTEPLTLIGPAGTHERLRMLSDALGSFILDPGCRLFVREIGPGAAFDLSDGVRLAAAKTRHTDESLAYRLEAAGASLGYTGDTGADGPLGAFLLGVDALISECSLPDAQAIEMHLSPSSVARLAVAAAPGRLLLTHIYPQLDSAAVPGLVRVAGWDGEVAVVKDGDRFEIGGV